MAKSKLIGNRWHSKETGRFVRSEYVRITVNERIRVPEHRHGKDRMIEVHVSRILHRPTENEKKRAEESIRREVARRVTKEAQGKRNFGESASRVVGVERQIIARKERDVTKAEVRDAEKGERGTADWKSVKAV